MKTRQTTLLTIALTAMAAATLAQNAITVTHGPILGRVTSNQVGVWARTSAPGTFRVRFGETPESLLSLSAPAITVLDRDNTGSVVLEGLKA